MAAQKTKQKHLGRGLQSLMGPAPTQSPSPAFEAEQPPAEPHEQIKTLPLDQIQPNPYQPRTAWDSQQLEELAASIRDNGLLQPVLVRKFDGQYQIIAGERRCRAARLAQLETVPVIIRKATDEQMLELALVENIQRTDLNPIERAAAYRQFIESFSLTQTEAADKLGENRSVIANHLRLLDLPQEIKEMLIEGQLSMGHARAILALPTDDLRRKLAHRALAGRLSVREVERLVRKHLEGPDDKKTTPKPKPAHIDDLEKKLTQHLGTKVTIDTRKNGRHGKITIEFYSLEDFDRIAESLNLDLSEDI